MGTTIGATIDYLVELFTNGFTGTDPYGQSLTVQSLPSINDAVIIGDTRPADSGDVYVVVGRESADNDSEITASADYQVLGRQRITESYSVPGVVLVLGEGPDQKPVRDAALDLFNGITKLVWADPTLNGILLDGRIALVSSLSLSQPDGSAGPWAVTGGGVAASLSFALQVENSYIP